MWSLPTIHTTHRMAPVHTGALLPPYSHHIVRCGESTTTVDALSPTWHQLHAPSLNRNPPREQARKPNVADRRDAAKQEKMSFGASSASRSASHLPGPTPPGVGPGRYEFHSHSSLGGARHGDSALGSSVFVRGVPGAGAALPGPRQGVPGPGAHRPEVYGAIGYSAKQPPRVSTMTAVRKVSDALLPSYRG